MNVAMPRKCPACEQNLYVCELRCSACGTEVQGKFELGRFARLSRETLEFLETFIRCRGNLKDAGALLSISYPTARNRLDALIVELGFEDAAVKSTDRLDILLRLKQGELTPDEALAQLEGENRL